MSTKRKPYTRQGMFNVVCDHLLTQNAQALGAAGQCLYRAPAGKKCAIGALIPDDLYIQMEDSNGFSIGAVIKTFPEIRRLFSRIRNRLEVLANLQRIHDDYDAEDWPERLKRFACHYNLKRTPLLRERLSEMASS